MVNNIGSSKISPRVARINSFNRQEYLEALRVACIDAEKKRDSWLKEEGLWLEPEERSETYRDKPPYNNFVIDN